MLRTIGRSIFLLPETTHCFHVSSTTRPQHYYNKKASTIIRRLFLVPSYAAPSTTTNYIKRRIITNVELFNQPRSRIFVYNQQRSSFSTSSSTGSLYMSTVDDDETITSSGETKTFDSIWDVAGLKKEVTRNIQRAHKKIGKIQQRYQSVKKIVEELTTNPSATLEQLESCPDIVPIEQELQTWQERLRNLNQLENDINGLGKAKAMVLPESIAQLAISLQVSDTTPQPPPRGSKKPKGPKLEGPRKPYRRYYSKSNNNKDGTPIEIRVGKKADDNDELSTNPIHRDSRDWWMHASGCPGSHVVIRYTEDDLPTDVINDAAALAARYSKCFQNSYQGTISVTLTRCRDVKKPPGAKPGLVLLTGPVRKVIVPMKDAEQRLQRLESTMLQN